MWLPSDHMFTGLQDVFSTQFFSADDNQYAWMLLAVGIDTMDRDGFSRWEPNEFRGAHLTYCRRVAASEPVSLTVVGVLCSCTHTQAL